MCYTQDHRFSTLDARRTTKDYCKCYCVQLFNHSDRCFVDHKKILRTTRGPGPTVENHCSPTSNPQSFDDLFFWNSNYRLCRKWLWLTRQSPTYVLHLDRQKRHADETTRLPTGGEVLASNKITSSWIPEYCFRWNWTERNRFKWNNSKWITLKVITSNDFKWNPLNWNFILIMNILES